MNFRQMVMSALKNNTNPIFANLVEMAENNDTAGLEQFARNYYKEQGKDFDKDFEAFKTNFFNKK